LTPFMSCSAKLPVYILFAEMFFAKNAVWAAYSMYVIGLLLALLLAWILHKTDRNKPAHPLLIELPVYKIPSFHTVFIYVWDKVKDFLTKAGTTIFIASILLWIVMHIGPNGYTEDISVSLAAIAGKGLAFFLIPCGLGFWQIAVALIAGLSAKEVVVSSTAVLFGIANVTSFGGLQLLHENLAAIGFGPLNAYCMMLFCLLYIPCAAALATIKRESGSLMFAVRTAVFQLAFAWAASALVFQTGSLFMH
ncbi:MAG: ferrous iron transporter B, partial [Erysipelotrichaceae bacterium]|nr:ferrous iron transporter B [Erysipelotrichaceae bacterium]